MTPPTETRIDTGVAAHRQPRGPERIEVAIVSDRRVSAVALRYNGTEAVGTARCHPNDRPDWSLGETLALARALHALARRLHADAQARIEGGALEPGSPPSDAAMARAVQKQIDHFAWADGR